MGGLDTFALIPGPLRVSARPVPCRWRLRSASPLRQHWPAWLAAQAGDRV